MNHFIVVREDAPGQFTAYPLGMPELSVTTSDRADAVLGARDKLNDLLVSGNLVQMTLPGHQKPRSKFSAEEEESASRMQRVYEEELERSRREDLERTLAEYETECPAISSTRTM